MRTMRAGRCYYRTTQADRETDLRSIEDHLVMAIPPRVAAYRLTSRECDRDGLRIVPTAPVSFEARDADLVSSGSSKGGVPSISPQFVVGTMRHSGNAEFSQLHNLDGSRSSNATSKKRSA